MLKKKQSKNPSKWVILFSILFIGVFISVMFPNTVLGQNSTFREFSLLSAQEFAAKNSYDSKKSQLDIFTAQKMMKETLSAGFPQIDSSVGYFNNLKLATILIPNFFEDKLDEMIPVQFGTQHNANVNFTVSQLIFNGSYLVGLQASKVFRQLADQNHELTKLNVIETVTNTYFLILVSEESERILSSNLSNLKKTHYEIKELYNEGFVEESDADLVQISMTRLKNNIQAIKRQKDVAYKLLKFQMGLDLNEPIALTDKLEDILQRIDLQKIKDTEFKLAQNIDFKLIETQEKLSELELKNEKMKFFPSVAAFYNFQLNALRNKFNFLNFNEKWYQTQMLGLNVNIPLFKSGALKARVQQVAISLEKTRYAKQQAAEGLVLEAARAKANLDSAYDNYVNTKDNMKLSKKVYDVTLIKYKEGVASSMDLTLTHDKYLMVQIEFIQAMSELLTANNKLNRLNNNYLNN